MVITLNMLNRYGFAKPIAEALNARKDNETLWNAIRWTGLLLAIVLILPFLIFIGKIFTGGITPTNPAVFVAPLILVVELVTIEVTAVADWYTKGHKLVLCPDGSWAMVKAI